MTAEERAEQLFRDHINHHALYDTDRETITAACVAAIRAAQKDQLEADCAAVCDWCKHVQNGTLHPEQVTAAAKSGEGWHHRWTSNGSKWFSAYCAAYAIRAKSGVGNADGGRDESC